MLVKPTYPMMLHITSRLRDADKREQDALRWDSNEQALAADMLALGSPSWIACAVDPLEPVYAFGLTPVRPGVWAMWGFGTNRWPDVALKVSRWCRRVIQPSAPKMGHRIECYVLAEKESAHRWIERFGGVCEGTLRGYGKNGEDFKLYAWTKG